MEPHERLEGPWKEHTLSKADLNNYKLQMSINETVEYHTQLNKTNNNCHFWFT